MSDVSSENDQADSASQPKAPLGKPQWPTAEKIIAVAKAMRSDPKIWAIFERVRSEGELAEEDENMLAEFFVRYEFDTETTTDPVAYGMACQVLRGLSSGAINSFGDNGCAKLLGESSFVAK